MFMSIVSRPNSPLEGTLGVDLEALEQRVVVEVVLPHVQPPQVRMPLEGHPEHVVSLPLVPVGGGIDPRHRVYDRLLALDLGLDPHDPAAQVKQLVRKLEKPLPIHDRDVREVHDP
jgi:hypothetical protein